MKVSMMCTFMFGMRLLSLTLVIIFTSCALYAQRGGTAVYEFLNLANSATVAAMGGHHIAVMDDDLSLAARNPSLLNPLMHKRVSLSHGFHPSGINNSYLAYGHHLAAKKISIQAGLQYVNYGSDLVRRDNTGQDLGTFSANDYALTIGAAKKIEDRLSVGANLKLVSSQLGGYNSFGVATDLAIYYTDTTGRFGISMVARNAGLQLSKYADGKREPMPFELQIGINRELKHLPFRFSIIYRYLDRWNILYDDPDAPDFFLDLQPEDESQEQGGGAVFFDNLARHFVFNGELLIGRSRNFRLRFGYNHGIQRELRLQEYRSAAGFTYGFAFRSKRFNIAYGRMTYHLAGSINQLGIDVLLGRK